MTTHESRGQLVWTGYTWLGYLWPVAPRVPLALSPSSGSGTRGAIIVERRDQFFGSSVNPGASHPRCRREGHQVPHMRPA